MFLILSKFYHFLESIPVLSLSLSLSLSIYISMCVCVYVCMYVVYIK